MLGVCLSHALLAVYDEDLLEAAVAFLAGEIADELLIVGVSGVGVDAFKVRSDLMVFAEDGDNGIATHDLGTKGVG